MIGACAGDIIGSIYEGFPHKSKEFPLFGRENRFTDDSVLTIATAHTLLSRTSEEVPPYCSREDYARSYKWYGRNYRGRGYGGSFRRWLESDSLEAYGSFGNGSAMRVSPIGVAFSTEEEVLEEAEKSAGASHDHPEGIRGAQAVGLAVFLASHRTPKREIRRRIEELFGYSLDRNLEEIRPTYSFDSTCQGSVPESLICFFVSTDWEDAVRNAVSLGGDADTMADIAGAIAEAYYGGVPVEVQRKIKEHLSAEMWAVIDRFYHRFGLPLYSGHNGQDIEGKP